MAMHRHVHWVKKVSGINAPTLFRVERKYVSVHYPFHSSESPNLTKNTLDLTKLINNKSKKLFTGQVFEAFTT